MRPSDLYRKYKPSWKVAPKGHAAIGRFQHYNRPATYAMFRSTDYILVGIEWRKYTGEAMLEWYSYHWRGEMKDEPCRWETSLHGGRCNPGDLKKFYNHMLGLIDTDALEASLGPIEMEGA